MVPELPASWVVLDPVEEVEKHPTIDALHDLVRQLPPRLRRVIVGRYGLGEQPPCTLKEWGKELGLSGERVRQLQQEALTWLTVGLANRLVWTPSGRPVLYAWSISVLTSLTRTPTFGWRADMTRATGVARYPLCPFGYVLHANGHDYQRRRTKWRCAKQCKRDSEKPIPACDYLQAKYKHGFTTTIGRTHSDGSVRLAREIPYDSLAWKQRYGRRNSAESRNGCLQRLGLKRMPVHGLASCHVTVLLGDFVG